ncbi:MAG: peptidylprolyl isomerase [Rhizomicrobium sp.]
MTTLVPGPTIQVRTTLGRLVIEVYPDRAPLTTAAFLQFAGGLERSGTAFYRVVRQDNDKGDPPISVVQGGLTGDHDCPTVCHEPTSRTGILHRDGAISLARDAPGSASAAAFFICIGDQPSLDFGGRRNADGQGFAAFGRVLAGMDVVRAIHRRPTSQDAPTAYLQGQMLVRPVPLKLTLHVGPRR